MSKVRVGQIIEMSKVSRRLLTCEAFPFSEAPLALPLLDAAFFLPPAHPGKSYSYEPCSFELGTQSMIDLVLLGFLIEMMVIVTLVGALPALAALLAAGWRGLRARRFGLRLRLRLRLRLPSAMIMQTRIVHLSRSFWSGWLCLSLHLVRSIT